MRARAALALLLVPAALACATLGDLPKSTEPLDWSGPGDRHSVVLVTTDVYDKRRSARVWVVVLDGDGVVRTRASRWFADVGHHPPDPPAR